ncbi:hypothetical protein [Enterobacter roggenkampii]|uniref:hypothetical protein n=1 Tax=Enterobacter roggenkampii TaxID=1812935 RepID=UPI0021BC0D7E|nr:hypothetical protein [Enterobacter roggenkampii]
MIKTPLLSPVPGPGSAPVGDRIGSLGGEFIDNADKDDVNKMTKNKPTLARLLFSIAYLFVCCLAFFSLALIVVKFIISHEVVFDRPEIKRVVVVSAIAAIAAAVRSWLYALLDERKIRRKPPE